MTPARSARGTPQRRTTCALAVVALLGWLGVRGWDGEPPSLTPDSVPVSALATTRDIAVTADANPVGHIEIDHPSHGVLQEDSRTATSAIAATALTEALPAGSSLTDILDFALPRAAQGDASAACVAATALSRCRSRTVDRFAFGSDDYWASILARQTGELDDSTLLRLEYARNSARRVQQECRALDPAMQRHTPALLWQAGRSGHLPSLRTLLDPNLVRAADLIAEPATAALLRQALPAAFEALLEKGDPLLPDIWLRVVGTGPDPAMLAGRPAHWRSIEFAELLAERIAQQGGPGVRVPVAAKRSQPQNGKSKSLNDDVEHLVNRYFNSNAGNPRTADDEASSLLGLSSAQEKALHDPVLHCLSTWPNTAAL